MMSGGPNQIVSRVHEMMSYEDEERFLLLI